MMKSLGTRNHWGLTGNAFCVAFFMRISLIQRYQEPRP